MSALLLCCGCDAIRDIERAYCDACGEATDSYSYSPTEREAYAYERMSVAEKVKLTPGRSACFDGEQISDWVADELIQLGRAA